MLPVSAVGFSCLWASLLLVLLDPGISSNGLPRLGFLLGALFMLVVAYAKRDLIEDRSIDPMLFAGAGMELVPLLVVIAQCMGADVPLVVSIVAWAFFGCGFSLVFLEWPKVFIVAWKRDVRSYLGAAVCLSAIIFLFSSALEYPYADASPSLLLVASVAVFYFVSSRTVGGLREAEEPSEGTKLYLATGISLIFFGMLFGIALFELFSAGGAIPMPLLAVFVFLGAGAHALAGFAAQKYPSFSFAEKLSLVLCAIVFVLMVVFGESWTPILCVGIVAVWIYLDLANISALFGFASGHASPFWRVARGQFVVVGGVALGWGLGFAASLFAPQLVKFAPFVGLGIVFILAITAILIPFKDNTFADKGSGGDIAEGGYFSQRCQRVAHQFKLSEREAEVLEYLAKGRNAQFISEQLCISAYTVKTHVYHIYRKMGINSQQELITIVDAAEVEYC